MSIRLLIIIYFLLLLNLTINILSLRRTLVALRSSLRRSLLLTVVRLLLILATAALWAHIVIWEINWDYKALSDPLLETRQALEEAI